MTIDPKDIDAHHRGTLTELLGVRFVEASRERVVAEVDIRDQLRTVGGPLHGGTLMALADIVGATATFLNLPPGTTTTTVESKTNFFEAGRDGVVRAESTTAAPRPTDDGVADARDGRIGPAAGDDGTDPDGAGGVDDEWTRVTGEAIRWSGRRWQKRWRPAIMSRS